MSDQPSLPVKPVSPVPAAPDPQPLSRGKKVRDFLIGFFGGLVVNGGMALLIYYVSTTITYSWGWIRTIQDGLMNITPWVINAGMIILPLLFKRRWITFGVLSLYLVGFIITIVLGLLFLVFCFVYLAGSSGSF